MQEIKIKIPKGLVTEIAQKRFLVSKYETHRGFKALAFYLLARTLTTSNGIYRDHATRKSSDGLESWSKFNKTIAKSTGVSFNTVATAARWAQELGFVTITPTGYQFVSVEKIAKEYGLYFPENEIQYQTITINPHNESLEHILKTLVFGENFDRQEYVVLQKIKRIPGIEEKLSKYIDKWQHMPVKKLLQQIVLWQKATFTNYTKGTEAYDLFHSIHADIALTCKRITQHFAFKSKQSSMYIKKVLAELQYMKIEKREVKGNATRKPHEADGSIKPITFVYMAKEQARKWLMPDLITLNLKNLQN